MIVKKLKRMFKKVVSVALILGILTITSIIQTSALAFQNEAPLINSGSLYYIKNLHSGKYLDVAKSSNSDGANVIQYHFTGGANQQWKVVYDSNKGFYKLYPGISNIRCLDVYNVNSDNRVNIDIYEDSNNVSRQFSIKRNSDGFSYRILTACSNYGSAVTVSGASCDDNANVFQYEYSSGNKGNDEWIFEPVNRNFAMGVNYAKKVYNKRVETYPNLNALGDCTNFVSQCMLAGGVHIQNEWYIKKFTIITLLQQEIQLTTVGNINI